MIAISSWILGYQFRIFLLSFFLFLEFSVSWMVQLVYFGSSISYADFPKKLIAFQRSLSFVNEGLAWLIKEADANFLCSCVGKFPEQIFSQDGMADLRICVPSDMCPKPVCPLCPHAAGDTNWDFWGEGQVVSIPTLSKKGDLVCQQLFLEIFQ